MPRDMEGQARAALTNLKRGLEAVGASFADVVTWDRFVTDLSDQDALNRFGPSSSAKPGRQRRRCKWCGSPPIRVAWPRSTPSR
jgi:enamine deaminase RidA (YjgF/YER057c/UK114 family)